MIKKTIFYIIAVGGIIGSGVTYFFVSRNRSKELIEVEEEFNDLRVIRAYETKPNENEILFVKNRASNLRVNVPEWDSEREWISVAEKTNDYKKTREDDNWTWKVLRGNCFIASAEEGQNPFSDDEFRANCGKK